MVCISYHLVIPLLHKYSLKTLVYVTQGSMYNNVHSDIVYINTTLKLTGKETTSSWYSHKVDSGDNECYMHQHE